jgi:hypothetical protein
MWGSSAVTQGVTVESVVDLVLSALASGAEQSSAG